MSDTPLKRPTYWLEGTATVPLITRNKLWLSAGLAVLAMGALLAVPSTGSPFLALVSLVAPRTQAGSSARSGSVVGADGGGSRVPLRASAARISPRWLNAWG